MPAREADTASSGVKSALRLHGAITLPVSHRHLSPPMPLPQVDPGIGG